MLKPKTSAKKLAKASKQPTLRFELKGSWATITDGGKACKLSGLGGTVLCDRPIQRNTGLHEAEFKQTSYNEYAYFGMASATVDLEMMLGVRSLHVMPEYDNAPTQSHRK